MTRISIIVPVLDEADGIAATLGPLQPLRATECEIIVVDGGSRDGTPERAAPLADRVVIAQRGRAAQMNAGATVAAGDVLLFLHADSHLAPEAVDAIPAAMAHSRRQWGRFDVAIAGHNPALRIVAAMMNLRSRLTGIATGDQGIFVERALCERIGGFPAQPLMEDVELSRRLKQAAGAPLCLRTRIVTSGRRWETQGTARTVVAMWRLRFAYWRGVDPGRLAAQYADVRGSRGSVPAPTLQIFAKAPLPGSVKTRLAATLGDAPAAAVHAQLVERTLATAVAARTAGIVGAIELWAAPDATHPAFARWRDRYGVAVVTQVGDDLGTRMRHALDRALARGAPAVLVGTDCPALDVDYLSHAAAALAGHDAVFGPAEDGGYVLVGLSRRIDPFAGIAWGTPGVMTGTRARLAACGATWHELPPLWDVDREADLARWRALAPEADRSTVANAA
jgi:rSAM/selenodomain-associated transferase 2/rSAM/selenodomain-associated transferase 1